MSDDLIKKKEAREAICKGCLKDWKICHHHWDCPMLTNLEMLPTVNRPQGEWIYVTVEEWLRTGRDYGHHCSECDEINKNGKSNFCPNCGARMKGADDEVLRQL